MAHFYGPGGLAVDSAGNVYVADTNNDTIRKITAAGDVTTLAGTADTMGTADGTGVTARFDGPTGVAADSAGNVYVADHYNATIRKVTAAGVVTTLAGTARISGSADGTGAAARFNQPFRVAVDNTGNVYVADNYTIRKVTAAGVVTTLAGTAGISGSADATGAAARFDFPCGVAVDSVGNVYVADLDNATIRKVTPAGVVTTLAGTTGMHGSIDSTGTAARFGFPYDVAVDSAGNVYVADLGNDTIRKITAAGVVTTLAGTAGIRGSADGTGATVRFDQPVGVAVDSAGNVYVTEYSQSIRKVTATGVVTTLAGTASVYGGTDGTGAAARFSEPSGVAVDSAGNIYVADNDNHVIRKVTAAGIVTTLAGTAGMGGSADGMGAAARFFVPSGVAVDSADNVYVADNGNDTIRKITPSGVVTTLAGTAGERDCVDGTGAAARFDGPRGVAVDNAGNVYVADDGNNAVRKVTPAGVVTTLAGHRGQASVDGTETTASFSHPFGVAVDSAGNLYVTDNSSNTIRKVTPAGVVTTLAGTADAVGSADGMGAAARFNRPFGVAVDSADNVYVADQFNSTIRKITATGTTTTIAGEAKTAGVRLGATPRFAFPAGLVVIGDSIVVSDANAILILKNGAQ